MVDNICHFKWKYELCWSKSKPSIPNGLVIQVVAENSGVLQWILLVFIWSIQQLQFIGQCPIWSGSLYISRGLWMYYHIFSITSAYINGAQFTVEYIRPFRFISCNSSFLSKSALQRHIKILKHRNIHQPFVDHITIIIICPIKIIFSMTLFMFFQTKLSPVLIVCF